MAHEVSSVGIGTLKNLLKKEMVGGLKDVVFQKYKLCRACQARKQVANTHHT